MRIGPLAVALAAVTALALVAAAEASAHAVDKKSQSRNT